MQVFKNKIWIGCVVFLGLHQVLQKVIHWNIACLDNYVDPFLGIPVLLGGLLQERRYILTTYFKQQLGQQYQLSILETLVITFIFALLFEEGFPKWSTSFTKDNWDYLAYGAGSFVFYYFINKSSKRE